MLTLYVVVLANDFDIRDGMIDVTLPEVITGNNYSLDRKRTVSRRSGTGKLMSSYAVWGDSGNWGPQFTIVGIDV